MRVEPLAPFVASLSVPGDKSVTHRALLLAGMATGTTVISGAGGGEDNHSTAHALRCLGVEVWNDTVDVFTVRSGGVASWRSPAEPIDCGNSGTTARLLAGLLAGAGVAASLTGDDSLRKRPMARVAAPLTDLGYDVQTTNGLLPLVIGSRRPDSTTELGVRVVLKVASAQVKSCLILCSLAAGVPIQVVEPSVSRDHTERMLRSMGVRLTSSEHYLRPLEMAGATMAPTTQLFAGPFNLRARAMEVPGDSSSAAYWAVLAGLTRSTVTVEGVGVNPTRSAWMNVLERMGLEMVIRNRRVLSTGEPVADVTFHGIGPLRATTIEGAEVPLLIDEIPILSVAGAFSEGEFIVRDAEELRVKESDRVQTTAELVERLGIAVTTRPDGLEFTGTAGVRWAGAALRSHGDHRLAMSAMVALLAAQSAGTIEDYQCAAVSYPGFAEEIVKLGATLTP